MVLVPGLDRWMMTDGRSSFRTLGHRPSIMGYFSPVNTSAGPRAEHAHPEEDDGAEDRHDPAGRLVGRGAQAEQVRDPAAEQRAEDAQDDRAAHAHAVVTGVQ